MKRTICIILATLGCVTVFAGDGIHLRTVVIDAGHGGKDAGCISRDRKTYEKTLTLDMATKVAEKIRRSHPDVKVILTRDDNTFVELRDRSLKANRANADLFISIHIDAQAGGTSANGHTVYVLGQYTSKNKDLFASNMAVFQRENSVILLEDDYSTKYQGFNPADQDSYIFMQLMQSAYFEQSIRLAELVNANLDGGPVKKSKGVAQGPFYVLWACSMPSILIELGYISNPQDLSVLRDEAKRDELAERICRAFGQYKAIYDNNSVPENNSAQAAESISENEANQSTAVKIEADASTVAGKDKAAADSVSDKAAREETMESVYAVQIFVVSRKIDPDSKLFLGFTPTVICNGGKYKYFISTVATPQEAKNNLKKIKKSYPDAFAVKITGERIDIL